MALPPDKILADLSILLASFNGKEYSGDIGAETLFFADLGMASIDAVILAETLEHRYGHPFPFQQFLSELSQRGARDVSVGELAAFLQQHLR